MNSTTVQTNSSARSAYTQLLSFVPSNEQVQRGLLLLTTATAFLSILPPLRQSASLALRSTAVLSSTAVAAGRWTKENLLSRALLCSKIAVVALGCLGAVLSKPFLIVASLAADIGLNAIEMARSLARKEGGKALIHLGIAVLDTLVLAAITTHSLKYLVVASLVNTAVLIGAGIKAEEKGTATDIFCYATMALLSLFNIVSIIELTKTSPSRSHFLIKNRENNEMTFVDNKGNVLARAQPGEIAEFSVVNNKQNTIPETQVITSPGSSMPVITVIGYKIRGQFLNDAGQLITRQFRHEYTDYETIVTQPALSPQDFHTVPVGGTALVSDELM